MRAEFFAYHFGRHPRVSAGDGHFDADVVPGATRAKVADFQYVVIGQQNAVNQKKKKQLNQNQIKAKYKINVLWTLEIAVNDLVLVEVLHAGSDLHRPVDGEPRRQLVLLPVQIIVQRAIWTVLHDDAVIGRLSASTPDKMRKKSIKITKKGKAH